jgi:hypothetical protein
MVGAAIWFEEKGLPRPGWVEAGFPAPREMKEDGRPRRHRGNHRPKGRATTRLYLEIPPLGAIPTVLQGAPKNGLPDARLRRTTSADCRLVLSIAKKPLKNVVTGGHTPE